MRVGTRSCSREGGTTGVTGREKKCGGRGTDRKLSSCARTESHSTSSTNLVGVSADDVRVAGNRGGTSGQPAEPRLVS